MVVKGIEMDRVLIIAQGRQALRLHGTYQRLGFETVAVYDQDSPCDLCTKKATIALPIAHETIDSPQQSIYTFISIAQYTGCDFIHPGFEELSNSYWFASACEASGLVLLGNPSETLYAVKKRALSSPSLGDLDVLWENDVSCKLKALNIWPSRYIQLYFSSKGEGDGRYMGSVEHYKRNSNTQNIYTTSPASSLSESSLSKLKGLCKESLQKFNLIGFISFNFQFTDGEIYLCSISPNISSFSRCLEVSLGLDFIEAQGDLFINGQLPDTIGERHVPSLSKTIFPVKDSIVKNILYPGGRNVSYDIDLHQNKHIDPHSKIPLAILVSYGSDAFVERLFEATKTFTVESY